MKIALLTVAAVLAITISSPWSAGKQEGDENAISEYLRDLFEQDQAARQGWGSRTDITPEEIAEMHRGDEERRGEVLAILADGMLKSGDDYFHAAMILQHGDSPEDYLLSHVLATVGGFEGHQASRWLAAASLDRYLQSIERPQIFGTQYKSGKDGQWTQEPIDAGLFPDALRKRYGVPGIVEAAAQLEDMRGR